MPTRKQKPKAKDTEALLPKMEAFIRTMHHLELDLDIEPKKKHICTCINYSDLNQLRSEFLRELLASVTRYVYSRSKQEEIIQASAKEGREFADAHGILQQRAREKFRPSDVQGQFSELLLFNLLNFHFKAVPLIRKMKITTNPALERNGADAIHIKSDNDKYVLYLGEAKTYTSGFKGAFKASLKSILDTFDSHRSELNLYKFEDFIEPDLRQVAESYINGTLSNVEVHLVSIVTYCIGKVEPDTSRDTTLELYIRTVMDETKKIKPADYPSIAPPIKARINYIFMPVNELEDLITEFRKTLGI